MDTRLRESFRFMLDNAGYSIPPGRAVCAVELARAELDATSQGYWFDWNHDYHGLQTTAMDEQLARIDAGETVYLWCACYAPDGEMVASVGGVEVTGLHDPYRRVIEAELAAEALHG